MMTTINPYIGFNGKCREALTFYQQVLGGELLFMPVAGSPIEEYCAPETRDGILHSTLTNGPLVIMGTDMTAPGGYVQGNSMAVSVNCGSEDDINTFFKKFAENGTIVDPLGVKFWGGMFGMIDDQFGIRWMFNYNENEQN